MASMSEALGTLGSDDLVVAPGIAHHLKATGRRGVVLAAGTQSAVSAWSREIEEELSSSCQDPEEAWFMGVDTGVSSMAIFVALAARQDLRARAMSETDGSTPRDLEDLDRCRRLLARFPQWNGRLEAVGRYWALRNPAWKTLADRWKEVREASPLRCVEILGEVNEHCPSP